MSTNTKKSDLEGLIENFLMHDNSYEQGINENSNRDYTIDRTYKREEVRPQ